MVLWRCTRRGAGKSARLKPVCSRSKRRLKQCRDDSSHPILGSQALARRVKPRQHYGYDLIVQVGRARYLENQQREEIRAELYRQRGITLSDGQRLQSL